MKNNRNSFEKIDRAIKPIKHVEELQSFKRSWFHLPVLTFLILMGHTLLAQPGSGQGGGSYNISGPTNVGQGSGHRYTLNGANNLNDVIQWTANVGTITRSESNFVDVRWDVAGTQALTVGFVDLYTWYVRRLTITVNPPPANPPSPTISSNGCGRAVLQRSGSPPSGVTWYWQTSSLGTSTSNSSSTYTVNNTRTYYIRARNSYGTWSSGSGSRHVSVANLTAGSINGTQTICYSGNPSTLGNSSSAGGISGGHSYQWQYSSNGSSGWANISGATSTSYNPPGGLTASRWYRRRITCASQTRYTSSIKVTVRSDLSAGNISGAQTICYSGNPGTLSNSSGASGNNGSYAYQWQYSSNGSSGWANISGAISTSYNPPGGLTASRWYRRRAVSCGRTKYTSSVKVTVRSDLSPGNILGTQTICYSSNPGTLSNSSGASGSNGSYAYQWQYSSNGNSGWANINGATSTSYDPPGGFTGSRWYRRRAVSCGRTKYTPSVKVTIRSDLSPGNISGAQTICYSGNPGTLSNSSGASGSNGSYVYQWQYSSNGSRGWIGINGANSTSFDPPGGLTASRWYRRRAVSCGRTKYTPSVKVTVSSDLSPGSISGAQTICSLENPGTLSNSSGASGSNGSYVYQWQYSSNGNSGWANISGATSTSYDPPGGLTASRWYRRRAVSCGRTKYTSSIKVTIIVPQIFYADTDGDGYGNPSVTTTSCAQPSNYVSNSSDHDDSTANITNIAPQTYYEDVDGDGKGDANDTGLFSFAIAGYVSNADDQCPDTYGTNPYGCDYVVPILSDENYVYSRTYRSAMTDGSTIKRNSDVLESITYLDGLGRPVQQLGIKAAPDKKDIITHLDYDDYGRQDKQWLPYHEPTGSVGSYRGDVSSTAQQYYMDNYADDFPGITDVAEINAYSQTNLETSPLNRALEQAAPGETWKMGGGHEIGFAYRSNTANEVRYYDVGFTNNNTETPELITNGHYTIGELYKTITYDENHNSGKDHSTEEFTNKKGQVVLKRTYDNETPHDTYYVYDSFGNLTYVLPPKVTTSDGVSATELSELCYQYVYDDLDRLVEKKVPGKGWEYIVYNKLDRPIMTQDPNLEAQDKWLFTKYDAFGRVAYTGMINNNSSRATVQTAADAVNEQFVAKINDINAPVVIAGTNVHYTNVAYPTVGITEVHSINYYDNDTFDKDGLSAPAATSFGETIISATKSLATGSKVRVLGTSNWITTLTGYDSKARPIYIISKNQELGTTDIVETKLDFVGKVLETKTTHTKGSNTPIVVTEKFTYDHAARLLTQTHQVGSSPEELIVSNTYDELGQLVEKAVGGLASSTNRLQSVDYTYNVRGWLKTINDVDNIGNDLFSFKIAYNNPTTGTALYNGNISQTSWKTANTDSSLKNYTYTYDPLNRITAATDNTGNYNLSNVSYDKNGNILSLDRKGHTNSTATTFGTMDNLVYSYDNGNKLTKVVDNGNDTYGFKDGTNTNDDFEYDHNGNLTLDRNKGITSIVYNHLNLPTQVLVDGNGNVGNISYIYDAAGIKIKKIVNNTAVSSLTTTEYAGNYIYENDNLQFFNTAEGYVELVTSSGVETYDYIYQYKDHLGNVRLSYSDTDGNGSVTQPEIREENNYYPFGLQHKGYNNVINGTEHKYTFNGKEEQEELGLNWHDFGFRNYDASIGRWMNIDNLAQEYYNYSPYTYTANNPIYYIDPDGQQIIIHYQDDDGNDQEHIYKYGEKYDGDNKFIKNVYASFNHLMDNNADTTGLIKRLAGDELGDVSILQNTKENNPYFDREGAETYFNSNNNTVIWDPEVGISQEQNSVIDFITGDGYEHEALVSPAQGLLHELGHAESSLENPEQHEKDSKTVFNGGWDNKEEFDVINKIENPSGKKLNRDRTRSAHRGKVFRTVSPTSVKPKKEKKKK